MAYSLSGMANTHNMLSVYSTGGNSTLYQRPLSSQQYQQLDSKPMCSSNWTIPYSEDTSPIDTYNLEQSQAYIPQSTAVAHTNMYPPSCRWTQPLTKAMQQGGPYFDQDLHFAHANHRLVTSSDISPLNTGLASLHLSLPERPHPQQPVPLDSGVPQRQLPMPHPSPAQTNRNVVDQMQDARLRSAQATGTSTMDNRGSFAKPLLPWAADSENNTNASQAVPADAFTQAISPSMSDNAESRMGYLPNTTSTADDDAITATTASQLELNFSASSLLDAMSAPAPTSNYSYVRESRQMARPTSQANLYSYSPSSTSKRNSLSGESSSDCVLVSGHRYTPLSHSQSQTLPGNRSLHRESCQSRNVQLHRTSMGNLNSTY
ncbi:hypothetical protein G6011_02327 [Alternaria panax]|uniref:Uncharacterized protein n=1 Tax=Alternaria panax TaxID=48097 RepID=A0AAD4FIZ2_9PLEO|nr:hypothetical protein G6011_02327 [Alternaria panax]